MDFNLNQIGLANLTPDGFNAVQFSIIGMLAVFCGLAVISLYIAVLPRLLLLFRSPRKTKKRSRAKRSKTAEIPKNNSNSIEIFIAIAAAMHLHRSSSETNQKITWQRYDAEDSPWQTAGKIRSVAVRSHLTKR